MSLNADCIAAADSSRISAAPVDFQSNGRTSATPVTSRIAVAIERPAFVANGRGMDFSKPPSDSDLQEKTTFRHKPLARRASKMQCLGDAPWKAGRLRGGPTEHYVGRARANVNESTRRLSDVTVRGTVL